MNRFVSLEKLNPDQKKQYKQAIADAFPAVITESNTIKKYWDKIEKNFPEYQQFLLSPNKDLVGFINLVPIQYNGFLDDLPNRGWDWMVEKSISDFQNNNRPNNLGGLQIIVREEYQKQGYSKVILNHAKELLKLHGFKQLLIPIRPTRKHEFPEMEMLDYIKLKENQRIFDPWIRTHLKAGAEIIKVCNQSMTMQGDIKFWEKILNIPNLETGRYQLTGALNLVSIDRENDYGCYIEPNIWIKYN